MLGRKIIEVYTDENSPDSELPLSKDAPGLPVRRLKSAGLRIITENQMMSSNYLSVPDPKGRRDSSSGSAGASIITPDTTHTFGLPNPTSLEEAGSSRRTMSLSDASSKSAREQRINRYSRQENALRSSFQHSSCEPPRRDLQIRALERATALLSAHAKEAQERANRLRAALSQRDVDPDTFKTLQRERWMEERRGNSRAEESKALKQLLLKLSGSDYPTGPPRAQSLPGGSDINKRLANLLFFSQRSPTKLIFPRRRRAAAHQQVMNRTLTIRETRPIRLRASAPVPAFSRPVKGRLRTKSLQSDLPAASSRTGNTPLAHGNCATPNSPPRPLVATPMTVAQGQAGLSSAALGVVVNDAGVATIYASQQPRTREQIDSDMNDVGLPSYALDLLGGFDDIRGEISLSSVPTSRPSSAPAPAQNTLNGGNHIPVRDTFPHISHDQQSSSLPRRRQPSLPPPKSGKASIRRRPISSMLPGHKRGDSDSSGGPGSSVRMSGDGVVIAERPSTPLGSTHSGDKHGRWGVGVPSLNGGSPAKALSKVKNRLSMIGGRR